DLLHVVQREVVHVALVARLGPSAHLRAPRLLAFDRARGFELAETDDEDARAVPVEHDRRVALITIRELREREQPRCRADEDLVTLDGRAELDRFEEIARARAREDRD